MSDLLFTIIAVTISYWCGWFIGKDNNKKESKK